MEIDGTLLKNTPALILPGWQDSEPEHWQSLWQSKFGWKRVVQKNWQTPKKSDWTTKVIQAIREQKIPPILIAHSLGVTTVAHAFLLAPDLRIRGAFLVAPPDFDEKNSPAEIQDFNPTPLRRLPFPSLLVASSNDPYGELAHAKTLARHWGSDFKSVGERHHIGVQSKVGEWEEGQQLLADFLNNL